MASSSSSFGRRLKGARARRGFTQIDLAEHSGVSYATIKAWELRDDAPVAPTNLDRVAHVLNVTVDSLVAVDGNESGRVDRSPVGPTTPAASRLTDDEWETMQTLLPRMPETMLVSELSRRVTIRAARESHDQSNVEPIGVRGVNFSDDQEKVDTETEQA